MASPPFDNKTEFNDDDPDSLLVKVSVSEVRGIEKRTRYLHSSCFLLYTISQRRIVIFSAYIPITYA